MSARTPLNRVDIRWISPGEQRYPTCGDWIIDGERLTILVSDLGDWRMNMLVALHEMIEVVLCHDRGITQDQVDKFDIAFECNRPPGDEAEPGDDINAPYRNEHCFATAVERMMCAALGIAWADYDAKVQGVT